MTYRGDYAPGSTLYLKFTTRAFASGVPHAFSNGAISAYKDNATAEDTVGITFTADFDGRTGLNHITVDMASATASTFYAAGSHISLVVTGGSVSSASIVGEVVASFSINATSALRPTTAGRTLDVDASGGCEVGSFQAGAITAAAIATDAIDADALADGAITAATFAAGAITATVIATDAIDSDAIAATAVTELQSGLATQASVDTIDDFLDTEIAAIKAKTDSLTFTVAGVIDANVLRFDGTALGAQNISKTTQAIGRGTCDAGSSTTSVITSSFTPNGAAADQFKGRIITFDANTTTTALRGQSTDITASSNAAAPTFTVTALTTAPASGDTFSVT